MRRTVFGKSPESTRARVTSKILLVPDFLNLQTAVTDSLWGSEGTRKMKTNGILWLNSDDCA